jgi:excinuclease ABC subunit C
MLSEALQNKLATLPTTPGVYIMKDRQEVVVYVGKARNLRARVSQYFQPRSSDTRRFIPFLEELLGDIEVMLAPSDKDALLLENELIKKFKPRFNVRLRDDKNFISLRLSRSHDFPRLEVVRRIKKDGARYFGPYSSASSIRETLQVVNRHFQLRTCTDQVMTNRRRPCLQFQIKRCPAPCVYEVPKDDYARSVDEVALFLEGKADELTTNLQTRMKDAAKTLEFERAAQLRDQLQAIGRSLEKQRTVLGDLVDQDVVGFHREGGILELHMLFFRNGRLNGGRSFHFNKQEFPTDELVENFLAQYYDSGALVPKDLLLPLDLPGLETLAAWLSDKRGDKVNVSVPERGEKVRLLEMAGENAKHSFEERQRTSANALEALTRLQTRLRLPKLPRRIECFDMSTIQGQFTVGSQVAVTDGEMDKSRYRLYRVRGEAGQDDFASMYQVLTRRLGNGIAAHDLPDLILVDGGKGQLNVARAALKELGLSTDDVMLAGLAKSRVLEDEARFAARQGFKLADAWAERAGSEAEIDNVEDAEAGSGESSPEIPAEDSKVPRREGSALQSPKPKVSGRSRKPGRYVKDSLERSPERVFLPGQKNPVVLRQNTSELFLLQRLRDEAHRFAITFHRKLRRERNFKSVLEEIEGIGDKRKRSLLSHFGSLKRIRAASAEEIAQVAGFNKDLAERVKNFLAGQGAALSAEVEASEAAEAAEALRSGGITEMTPEEVDAQPPNPGLSRGPESGPAAQALQRDDVAFDAAAAELSSLEDDAILEGAQADEGTPT